ncbi:hypothetical protein ASE17_00330 [Phenylobacterium sp. Root77]|uniref:hypothetical protein n=1 Tax=unclassified Phenylobacterium TaxID=2640670 RepID=UPI0006F3FB2F|nr:MULTISPECIES: hypothetical protein [unclassified Phenylobacterium]KQW71387.1 hypothetical protein ASC73_04555 [Phenylobacterium sp. Root1277]KQW94307.1 hypothetical protein ASC79_00700 [Phenylobacterium sp. Root1290]KRC44001.1 hypothetical protein ASE17_00330 [Phenylobacterium sp. Root77]
MFTTDDDKLRADWELLAHGAVTLFWRKRLFDDAKEALRALDYRLVEVLCTTSDQFTADVGFGLNWLGQFGYEPWTGNLDALNDGLRDPPFGPTGCLALCLEGFHQLIAENPTLANGVLDVIEYQSRNQLLIGRRLLALVQTNDGSFHAAALGARGATWNQAEWLNSSRILKPT